MAIGQLTSTGAQSESGGGSVYEVKFETTVPNGKLWIKFVSSQKLETASDIENYFKNYNEIDVNGVFVPTSEMTTSTNYFTIIPFAIYPRAYDWNVNYLQINISTTYIKTNNSYYAYTNIGNIVCREV